MIDDPLLPHLLDILVAPAAQRLILAGGFGLRIKQAYLASRGETTLITPIPPARPTTDLDLFLRMDLFIEAGAQDQIREHLRGLLYKPLQPNWQFVKPMGGPRSNREIVVDLMARHPVEGESVKLRPPRVGQNALHGRSTEEAFAIELNPLAIPVQGVTSLGEAVTVDVILAHPYAMLNMKVRAAHDWLKMERGEIKRKDFSEKHAYDVYMLIAMLTNIEFDECRNLAAEFANCEIAASIRQEALALFSTSAAPGSREVGRRLGSDFNFESFDEGLRVALGNNPDSEI